MESLFRPEAILQLQARVHGAPVFAPSGHVRVYLLLSVSLIFLILASGSVLSTSENVAVKASIEAIAPSNGRNDAEEVARIALPLNLRIRPKETVSVAFGSSIEGTATVVGALPSKAGIAQLDLLLPAAFSNVVRNQLQSLSGRPLPVVLISHHRVSLLRWITRT